VWVAVLHTGRRWLAAQFALPTHSTQAWEAVSQYGLGGAQSPDPEQVVVAVPPPAPLPPPPVPSL
jgi:hypothetical protein